MNIGFFLLCAEQWAGRKAGNKDGLQTSVAVLEEVSAPSN